MEIKAIGVDVVMNLAVSNLDLYMDQLAETLDANAVLLRDLTVPAADHKYSIPLLLLHDTGVYAIARIPSLAIDALADYMTALHGLLQNRICVAPSSIMVYGFMPEYRKKSLHHASEVDHLIYAYDNYLGFRRIDTAVFENNLLAELETRENRFEEGDLLRIYDLFEMNREQPKSFMGKVKEKDGELYVQRRGALYESSELDSELNYYLTLFGGMCGLHKFYQRKWLKGVVYLLTCGFCGVGWLLDVVEIFFGMTKDRLGYYLLPVKNRHRKVFIFLLWLVPGFFAVRFYLYLCAGLFSAFAEMSIYLFELLPEISAM